MKNPRRASSARRRKVADSVFAEESLCWLCGRPVDMGLRAVYATNPKTGRRALHPAAPTVDEVVPVSLGGDPLDRANCRLAHNRCNRYRGARMDIEAVRRELRGEQPAKVRRRPNHSQDW